MGSVQKPWRYSNQIINLEIIGEEAKNKKNVYFLIKLTKFMQFDGEEENFQLCGN